MKFTNRRITVGFSKTVNTGNYEYVKLHAGSSVDIHDEADMTEAYNQIFDDCVEEILHIESDLLGKSK